MTGSTRTCISILNAFSLVSLLSGVAVIYIAVSSAGDSTTVAMVVNVSGGLGVIIVGTLLRAASEGLRLLSDISPSLKPARSAGTGIAARAA
ncbi:MAG: hypothetical protein E2O39_16710 [Planctomycetota bacterium]|nr:MAG: hypothetical protein E2O39_16710 [Planctomycetota bacterium]